MLAGLVKYCKKKPIRCGKDWTMLYTGREGIVIWHLVHV